MNLRPALWTTALLIMPGLAHAQVVWSFNGAGTIDEIRRANPDGTGVTTLVNPTSAAANPSPWAVAIDPLTSAVFYSDIIAPRTIYRASLSGPSTPVSVMTTTNSVMSMAVNSQSGQLYLSAQTEILRANLDGSNVTTLVSSQLDAEGIALDVAAGKMYWIDRTANQISRANLDGSNTEVVVNTAAAGTTTERGLAIHNNRLFYADAGTNDRIYTADLSTFAGTPLTPNELINLNTVMGGNATPNGLATDGTYLFWAEGATIGPGRGIYRALLDGTGAINLVSQSVGSPIGVAAVVPIPEPSSFLFGGLVVALAARGRRSRRAVIR